MNSLSPLALCIGPLIPGFLWILFYLREDLHPEPKRLLLYTFNIGMLMSVPVLAFQMIFQRAMGDMGADGARIGLIIGLALIEEFFKFCAAFWATKKHKEFDEPVDAMIYMIAASLGFATIENFFVALNILYPTSVPAVPSLLLANLSLLGQTLFLRFAGATFLHTLSSGTIGYYWAREKFLHAPRVLFAFGLLLATIIHSGFNYLIFIFQDTNLLYPTAFLVLNLVIILYDFEKLKPKKALPI